MDKAGGFDPIFMTKGANIPHHIAIIPDGNRRWAKARGFLPWDGHKKGAERFKEITDEAFGRSIRYVTFWAASESNLTERSKEEVMFLVMLLKKEIERMTNDDSLVKNEVRVRILGEWDRILNDAELRRLIQDIEKQTAGFEKHYLTILFGYDGKNDMLGAIEKLIKNPPEKLDADTVQKKLETCDLPPVDLVIRTGGEPHWSAGFMMWHTRESQFYFTEKFFPDFDAKEFGKALEDFAGRERRFGK